MKKDFTLSIFAILNLMFLALFYLGCSLSTLEQNPKNALDPPQRPEPTPAKTEESIFTVIELIFLKIFLMSIDISVMLCCVHENAR